MTNGGVRVLQSGVTLCVRDRTSLAITSRTNQQTLATTICGSLRLGSSRRISRGTTGFMDFATTITGSEGGAFWKGHSTKSLLQVHRNFHFACAGRTRIGPEPGMAVTKIYF